MFVFTPNVLLEKFSIQKIECGQQLDAAMKFIQENGDYRLSSSKKVEILYIINSLKLTHYKKKGLDTVRQNLQLGLHPDDRDLM